MVNPLPHTTANVCDGFLYLLYMSSQVPTVRSPGVGVIDREQTVFSACLHPEYTRVYLLYMFYYMYDNPKKTSLLLLKLTDDS